MKLTIISVVQNLKWCTSGGNLSCVENHFHRSQPDAIIFTSPKPCWKRCLWNHFSCDRFWSKTV